MKSNKLIVNLLNYYIYIIINIILQYINYYILIYIIFYCNYFYLICYNIFFLIFLYYFIIDKYILTKNLYFINFLLTYIYFFNISELLYYIDCYVYYLIIYIIFNIFYIICLVNLINLNNNISILFFRNWMIQLKSNYLFGLVTFNKFLYAYFFNDEDIELNNCKELVISNDSLFYNSILYYILYKKWKIKYFLSIFLYILGSKVFTKKIVYSSNTEITLQFNFFIIIQNLINYLRYSSLHIYIFKYIIYSILYYFNIDIPNASNTVQLSILENLPIFIFFSGFWLIAYLKKKFVKTEEDFVGEQWREIYEEDLTKNYKSDDINYDKAISILNNTDLIKTDLTKFKKFKSSKFKSSKFKLRNSQKVYFHKKKFKWAFFNFYIYNKYYRIVYYEKRNNFLNYFNCYFLGNKTTQLKALYSMFAENDTTYNMRLLFDEYIKYSLDSPFKNESNIPFTLFNFYQNKIDINKFNDFIMLMSYLVIFKQKKQSTIDLNYDAFKRSFLSFYLDKLEKKSVLNLSYYNHLLEPNNILENLDFSDALKIYVNNIEQNTLEDIENIIKKAFDDINNQIKESRRHDLLIYVADLEQLNKKAFIEFLDSIADLDKNSLSEYLKDFNLAKNVYYSPYALLKKFSEENFFYLDYISLIANYNKFSLCYLLFIYKVLKVTQLYNVYVKNEQNKFLFLYKNTMINYHKQVRNRFMYLLEICDNFVFNKVKNNSSNYSFSNFINHPKFINNRNSTAYFEALNKTYFREFLLKDKKTNHYSLYSYFFERYKDIIDHPYSKVDLDIPNIKTFDQYAYDSNINKMIKQEDVLNISMELKDDLLEHKKQYLKFLCSKYNFDDDDNLLNFEDLGYYYYNIEQFKDTKNDVFLFFNLRDSEYLNFLTDESNISLDEKTKFQRNYFLIYYNYILKNILSRKICFSNCFIENNVYENKDFYFKNLDVFDIDKLNDFNLLLSNFLNGFKYCIVNKRKIFMDLINNFSVKYPQFIETIEKFDSKLMYDSKYLDNLSLEQMFLIEKNVNNLYVAISENITKFHNIRLKYVNWINVLDIRKLNEFFEDPLFDAVIGLKQLKSYYFIVLNELIEEERLFDHLLNITYCTFRVLDKHFKYWRYEQLLKKGIFPEIALSMEEWDLIINEIEPNNPLIFILLYNSKAKRMAKGTKVPFLWNHNIKFKHIFKELSDCSERVWCYEGELHDEWTKFYKLKKNHKIINYPLTIFQVQLLKSMLSEFLHYSTETISIDNLLILTLKELNLKYVKSHNLYMVIEDNKSDTKIIKPLVDQLNENIIINIENKDINIENKDINIENRDINVENNFNILNDYLYNIELNFELIRYYEKNSLEISNKNVSRFLNSNWTNLKFLYYQMTDDINKYNNLKNTFKNLYLLNQTYLICNNFKINKDILFNILKFYTIKSNNLISKDFFDFKNFLQLVQQQEIPNYIDNYIYPYFNNVLTILNDSYKNEFLYKIRNNIHFLKFNNIEVTNYKFDNLNLKDFFSLIYNTYYNCYFFSSLILNRIEYLNKIINNFFNLLELNNSDKISLIKNLLCDLKKNKNEDNLFLLNLLINFKEPLLLLHFLNLDYQYFLEHIKILKDILDAPDYNILYYKNYLINYKLNQISNDSKLDIYTVNNFFSLYKIEKLKSCIPLLYNYINNQSYFNLSKYNLNDLDKFDFMMLYEFTNLQELININNLKNSEPLLFNFYKNNNKLKIFEYDILIKIPDNRILELKNELELINLYHYKKTIPKFISLYKKKVHVNKTSSVSKKCLLISSSKHINKKNNNIIDDSEVLAYDEPDVTHLLKKAADEYDIEKKNAYLEKKWNRMFESFTVYREWGYKFECIQCYNKCKEEFNAALSDMNNVLWNDVRFVFKNNYNKFIIFINNLTPEEKQKLFNVIWENALNNLLKEKQAIYDNWDSDRWPLLVQAVKRNKSDIIEYYGKELYAWKISWNESNWYLDLETYYKAPQFINELSPEDETFSIVAQKGYENYTNNKVYKHQHKRLIGNKNLSKEKLIKWWSFSDWWKF